MSEPAMIRAGEIHCPRLPGTWVMLRDPDTREGRMTQHGTAMHDELREAGWWTDYILVVDPYGECDA